MGRAKDIVLKVIPSKAANEFVKRYHYSGKVVQNSTLHLGAFLNGKLGGVMQYGNPIDKRKVLPLVSTDNKSINAKWNEMLELNRMAFSPILPRNSESRCISVSIRLIRKHAPQVKWILSFADGTQCGDGTIYRASGFHLTQIGKNTTLMEYNGQVIANKTLDNPNFKKLGLSSGKLKKMGAKPLAGYQLRYIYLLSPDAKLAVPDIPFSKIAEVGATMYKGKSAREA
jgi:hypothetical protein